MAIRIFLGHMKPHFGEGEVVGSAIAPFKTAMVVSYSLSIVTVAPSVTIRPQFAQFAQINWGGTLGQNFRVLPLE